MRRRLDLAAALVHNPDVLFLDEPTTGLDPVSRARVWEEIRRLNDVLGMTIFLTTQYLEEADELADRVGILNAGRLVAEGTPTDLKRSIGNDMIIARFDGDPVAAEAAVAHVDGVQGVDGRGNELVVTTANGAATIGPVAVALDNGGSPATIAGGRGTPNRFSSVTWRSDGPPRPRALPTPSRPNDGISVIVAGGTSTTCPPPPDWLATSRVTEAAPPLASCCTRTADDGSGACRVAVAGRRGDAAFTPRHGCTATSTMAATTAIAKRTRPNVRRRA
jgi:hypothetical protein